MSSFAQKTIVITGASSGIGRATKLLLREKGAIVYNLDILPDEDDRDHFLMTDMRSSAEIFASIRLIEEKENKIDGLFANAGKHLFASIEETTEAQLNDIVSVNILGVFHLLKAALPILKKQGQGAVVLMGSDQAFIGKGQSAVYGLTKGAIGQLTKSTAIDYAPFNIRVNCVCPGTIETPLLEGAVKRYAAISGLDNESIYEGLQKAQPLGRIGQPSEIATAVAFLLSEESSFMTGTLMSVDGGYICQ